MTKVASKKVNKAVETVNEAPTKKGWRIKQYYVNLKVFKETEDLLKDAPNQVRIMMQHFASNFNSPETAAQGKVLCQSAIDNNSLKTVIDPAVLFAYYRKYMEQFGLTLK